MLNVATGANKLPPKDIPPGILKAIFLYAVAPDFLLDPSLGSGPESPWCQALRMSKSFVAVNKSWNAVGTPFLYEHIVLRRVGQVVALRRTLHESAKNLAALVKSLDVRCYVLEDYKPLFDKSMLMIFQQCNDLSSFTFNAFSNFRSPIRLVPLDTLQQLTHFSYGDTVRPTDIFDQLPLLSGRLTSLVLPPLLELNGVSLDISFPSLRRLEVYATPSLAMLLAKNWIMPGLEELIVRYRYSFASMDPDFTHVFRAHGHSLKYLQFPPEQWQLYQLQNLDELCPNLEHLVVNPLCKIVSHPKIKWIDLCLITEQMMNQGRGYRRGMSRRSPATQAIPWMVVIRMTIIVALATKKLWNDLV
ncbi:hypothetical protein BD779DRAFT_1468673 [Infundibulicybe gibba]|nr:hypothetical protein BD779DRAFT_1468673 [Infundibulicybe gibba]